MKKLIIVCEEKLRIYGDFLAQLISRKDDTEDAIVGIKDGEAAAQVWTEKEYSNNAAQISSEQYILFIGNSKLIKEKRTHMQKKFSDFGMNYGWLGKQATLFVDHIVSLADYDNFFELASAEFTKGGQPEIAKLLSKKFKTTIALPESAENVIEAEQIDVPSENPTMHEKRTKKFILPINTAIKKTAEQGVDAVAKAADIFVGNINRATKNKSIEEQEYSCLVLIFYLNGLSEFLGLGESK